MLDSLREIYERIEQRGSSVLKYSDAQVRDDRGRWTDGGGGAIDSLSSTLESAASKYVPTGGKNEPRMARVAMVKAVVESGAMTEVKQRPEFEKAQAKFLSAAVLAEKKWNATHVEQDWSPMRGWFRDQELDESGLRPQLEKILAKAPAWEGVAIRGLQNDVDYKVGDVVEFERSKSASTSNHTFKDFMSRGERGEPENRAALVMKMKNGVDIRGMPHAIEEEREIIVRAGAKMRVNKIIDFNGTKAVIMEEI